MPDLAHNARVVRALVAATIATTLQYRANFWFGALSGLLENAGRVLPILLVYQHSDAVMGWSLHGALLVLAFFLLLNAVQSGLFEPNLGEAVSSVRDGNLDLWLLKPADAQLLVSVRKVDVSAGWELVAGTLIGAYALSSLPTPGVLDVLVALALFTAGTAALYGLWMFALCLVFWFVAVDNLRYLLWSITDAGRWPASVFGTVLRGILTWVVPVAVVTTFPAEALTGRWDGELVLTAMAVAALFLVGSRVAWVRSLARYTSASS